MESHVKGKRQFCTDNPGSLPISSDFKTHVPKVSLYGENQRGKSRERLESSQIRIGSIFERRVRELTCNPREEKSGGEVRG